MSNPFPPVSQLFRIAKVQKSHGTGGKVRLSIEDQFKQYITEGTFLFLDRDGSKVPYKVSDWEEGAHFVVGLENVISKQDSDQLTGMELWIPLESVKPRHQRSPRNIQDKWSDYHLLDINSNITYVIERVEEFPQQLMAVIIHDQKEKLIPLSDQLITAIDKEQKIISIGIPEGLLDI